MGEFLNIRLIEYENLRITIGSVLLILLGYFITRLLIFLFSKALRGFFKRRQIDVGRSYAVIQFVKYAVFLFFFLYVLNVIGVKLNYILTGSAALLVGVGIGLQQTFNDFFSGLIILFEGTVEVGDQLMFNDKVGTVKHIGLRTSKIETRDRHIIIVPNSHLVSNDVINLSHLSSPVRFHIDVGVSYDTDIDKLEEVLMQVIKKYPPPIKSKKYDPDVHLLEYADSAVVFRLFFYSVDIMMIERVKSNIRKDVFKALKENKITIPFPQRDLWIKSDKEGREVEIVPKGQEGDSYSTPD